MSSGDNATCKEERPNVSPYQPWNLLGPREWFQGQKSPSEQASKGGLMSLNFSAISGHQKVFHCARSAAQIVDHKYRSPKRRQTGAQAFSAETEHTKHHGLYYVGA